MKTGARLLQIYLKESSTPNLLVYIVKVSAKDMSWSDIVIVMEEGQRSEIAKRFPKQYMQKRILSLEIPDIYSYGQPKLIKELKSKDYENVLI